MMCRLGGSEGAQPPASPCRGPAKRGPKGYAGSRAVNRLVRPRSNLAGRVAHARGRPRVAGGSGLGSAAVDPRPLAPPKLTAEGIYALDPRVLWVTHRREVGSDGLSEFGPSSSGPTQHRSHARSRRCGLGGQQVWAKMPGHVGVRRHSFEGCRRGRKPDFYIVRTLDAKFTSWAFW